MPTLQTYHLVCAIVHAFLGTFFAIYFPYINHKYPNDPQQGIELSIRDHTMSFSEDACGCINVAWSSTEAANPPLTVVQGLMISFFFITAVFHLIYYLNDSGFYDRMIQASNNSVRWLEYSITATMMLYIIAMLCGLKDRGVYLMIGVTNVVLMIQGQAIEEAVRDGKPWWIPMASAFALLIAQFVVIGKDYVSNLNAANSYALENPNATKQKVPGWVTPMFLVMFLFFASFGFVSLYGAYSGAPYESVEKMYVMLSLVSKASLGIFVAYGSSLRQTGNV